MKGGALHIAETSTCYRGGMKIGNHFIPRPLRQDPLYQCAESLTASRDIPLEDHLVLRENLASYLSQMDPQKHPQGSIWGQFGRRP